MIQAWIMLEVTIAIGCLLLLWATGFFND